MLLLFKVLPVPALADMAHFWQKFGRNLALMCMSLLFEGLSVPALADLAHFWQQLGTDVSIQPQRLWRLLIVIQ